MHRFTVINCEINYGQRHLLQREILLNPGKIWKALLPSQTLTTINRIRIGHKRCNPFYSNDTVRIMQHVTASGQKKLWITIWKCALRNYPNKI